MALSFNVRDAVKKRAAGWAVGARRWLSQFIHFAGIAKGEQKILSMSAAERGSLTFALGAIANNRVLSRSIFRPSS